MRKRNAILVFICCFAAMFSAQPSYGAIDKETVERAWHRLSAAAGLREMPVNFEDKKEPNAWVAFKGSDNYTVHVTQGLMDILETEDQIAGIMGHEIGHIMCGHYGRGVAQNLGLYGLARIFGGRSLAADLVLGVGMGLAKGGFSREQEVEADDWGAQLAWKSGYHAWCLYDAMDAMKRSGVVTAPSGFNSHPPTERRLERLQYKAEEAIASGAAPERPHTPNTPESADLTPPDEITIKQQDNAG